ncbi:MAG TPA: hypothetical protein VGN33_09285 [Leifsonia sp.]|jgi:uncharacterized membrane protein|nr:hypothetical protein [Leifsonia sp.]
MSNKHNSRTAPIVATLGSVVAVLGALVAVMATRAASPIWSGVLLGLGLVILVILGVTIGNGRGRRNH